ncbi:ABC transporter ATP-binding protein [Siccirubricoccus sp. KC 17139]|uniref:ABC transporter ATP-binding protein n=1 Tax=Siccirubricoccus soli TaxID=2899147 RepID=A0ABT1DBG4_9PROT|nr:ABC transporter ATP-binding protein [Siccirubricoccus soli]MCO6419274.1 ABC transporter ATP-binding protein [Siccirubricoccus soli]MCP2685409.1 ABC transporter ATP-binding protein [Siccirubricoccus soli]
MIRITDLCKTYKTHLGPKTVLSGLSTEFRHGEKVGILGRNGAGKTTLLRLIAGVEGYTSGRIERRMSVSWPLGFAGAMHYSITGADNARFIARIYGKPIDWTVGFVEDFAELGEYFRLPVRTYSSGMMMRLGFALSLAVDFDCYLVDEVIAVGDSRFGERCRAALAERHARSTLLLVSHQAETVRAFCSSAAVLQDGRLTRYDDLDEAIAAYHAA